MNFTKITASDLNGKGVVGLPDTPGLTTTEMQEKFDELALDVIVPKFNDLSDELSAKVINADVSGAQNGQFLKYDETLDKWIPESSSATVESLSSINDVSLLAVEDGQTITYDIENEVWKNTTIPANIFYDEEIGDIQLRDKTNTEVMSSIHMPKSSVGTDMISEAWNGAKEYAIGDYAINGNNLYKALGANINVEPASSGSETIWERVLVTSELKKSGTVRYNSETDRLEVLYNNDWVPSINANAQWDGKIYSYGNEATSVTGGWTANGYAIDDKVVSVGTKNSDNLYMVGKGGSNTRNIFGTSTPINLQKYTKLVLTYKTVGSGGKNIFICDSKNINPESNYIVNIDDSSSVTTKVIDISNFAFDSAYIGFNVSNANTRGLYVYEAQFIV